MASGLPERQYSLLYALFAVQCGLVSRDRLKAAFHQRTAGPSGSFEQALSLSKEADSAVRSVLSASLCSGRSTGELLRTLPMDREVREEVESAWNSDKPIDDDSTESDLPTHEAPAPVGLPRLGDLPTRAKAAVDPSRTQEWTPAQPQGDETPLVRSPGDDAFAETELIPQPDSSEEERGFSETATGMSRKPEDAVQLLDGRYRILKLHAQGGLGRVFLAHDEQLGREVALKDIIPRHLHSLNLRERFVQEARINGKLEHPGIVPVYSLGRKNNGQPYYAMRYIEGQTLKEAITDYQETREAGNAAAHSLKLRELLGRFIDICEAIAYAHSRGVLHRDLKPSNVILGQFGETLVLDWGLAKFLGDRDAAATDSVEQAYRYTASADAALERTTIQPPFNPSSPAPTAAGQLVGTLGYMSPEQARGEVGSLGPSSDICSLGATLYSLLTGHAPFESPSDAERLEKARNASFPSPRSIDPTIPKPLEVICLKAMALKPEDRYANAQDLAEDVKKWLADEPVSAHRETWPERAARWGRRHRDAFRVGAAGLLLLSLVSTIAAGWLHKAWRNTQAARDKQYENYLVAERSKDIATIAWRKADDRFEDAFALLNGMLLAVERDLPEMGAAQGLREELASGVVSRSLSLLADRPEDQQLQRRTIYAIRVAANVKRLAEKDTEGSRRLYNEALGRLEEWSNRRPRDKNIQKDRVSVLLDLGGWHSKVGVLRDAQDTFQQALAAVGPLLRESPDDDDTKLIEGRTLANLGGVLIDQGRFQEARRFLESAIERYEELARKPDMPFVIKLLPPRARVTLAAAVREAGDLKAARAVIEKALVEVEELRRRKPLDPDVISTEALARGAQSRLLAELPSQLASALEAGRRSESLMTQLVLNHPQNPSNLRNLITLRAHLSDLCLSAPDRASTDRLTSGLEDYVKTIDRKRAQAASASKVRQPLPSDETTVAIALGALARAARAQGRLDEANELFRRAIAAHSRSLKVDPDRWEDKHETQCIIWDQPFSL